MAGITSQGIAFGANVNDRAILDMTSQFGILSRWWSGCLLFEFAEVDQHGNVGVHKFNGKNQALVDLLISVPPRRKLFFCGTLTAGQFKTEIADGKLHIVQEGRVNKFIGNRNYFGGINRARPGDWMFVTSPNGAVFTLKEDGHSHLIKKSPWRRFTKDILDKWTSLPLISPEPQTDGRRLFIDAAMGFVPPEAALINGL